MKEIKESITQGVTTPGVWTGLEKLDFSIVVHYLFIYPPEWRASKKNSPL
jgi:hypothetical protein